MRYIFENEYTNYDLQKGTNNSKYYKWMRSILKRSEDAIKHVDDECHKILTTFQDCDDKYIVIARKFLEISSFIEPEILQVEKPPLRRSSRYQHGYEDGLKYAMNQLNN